MLLVNNAPFSNQRNRFAALDVCQYQLLESYQTKLMYRQITSGYPHLHELGLTQFGIARKSNLDGKIVAKAIGWVRNSQIKMTK